MADNLKTGVQMEATGIEDYKKNLKDAAAAGETLEGSLKKLSESEGNSSEKSDKLNDAIKGLRQESKTLSAEMKALESSFDESTSAEDQAAAKKELLNRQIETQRGLLLGLHEQLQQVTESEGENSTAADKQREAIYKAQSALNKMEGELRETEASLDGTKGATEELGEATEELGEATDKSSEKVVGFGDVLKANLASQAIIKGLEKMADLVKEVGSAAYGASKDAAAYADTYLTLSTTTGLSTDQLQEFAYMSELVDVSLDTITGSMSKLITKMLSAGKGNKDLNAIFKGLGVSVTDANGSLRDSREVFFEVIDALGKIEDPTARDAVAMELFGKKAQDLNPLIAAGADGLKSFADEAHRTGYVLDEDTLGKLGALDDSFQRLENTKTLITNQFGAGFADSINNINTKLIELAQNLDWEALGESAGGVLDKLSEKAFAFVESIDFEDVGNKIDSFFAYLDEHGEDIAKTAEAIGIGFASWKAVGVVKGVVGGVKELYGWLEAVGSLIGVGGLTAAGGIGLGALAVGTLIEHDRELRSAGLLGDGHELREYADNVAYLEQKLQEAQNNFDTLALYAPDSLYMAQEELNLTKVALINAREEYEAMQAAKEAADAAGPDPVEQAEQAAANAKAASGAAQELAEAGEAIQQESEKQLQAFSERTGEITSTFVEGTDEMSQAAVEGIQKTQDAMETNMAILNANAEIWGDDMMRSMANGILGGANNYVVAAVETVAKAIEERLGFSEPDKGPLSRFHEFAPDMMALFAQGIREGQGLLDAAIGDVFDLGPLIAAQNGGGQNLNYGGVNVTIYGAEGQSADELYEVFSYRLQHDVADREAVFSS